MKQRIRYYEGSRCVVLCFAHGNNMHAGTRGRGGTHNLRQQQQDCYTVIACKELHMCFSLQFARDNAYMRAYIRVSL